LAELPDEKRGRKLAEKEFHQANFGPADAITPDVTDLLGAFDPARLAGDAKPLPASYVTIPENLIMNFPEKTGYGLKQLGITPVDYLLGIKNQIPRDFDPRPNTTPN
ncbi:MAG TPA: hypothetical protein VG722_01370, partial [Tepidisphaeraceae bacterium]|nr:hypothetical protein [Tepidisphaeraceae bacterium]